LISCPARRDSRPPTGALWLGLNVEIEERWNAESAMREDRLREWQTSASQDATIDAEHGV